MSFFHFTPTCHIFELAVERGMCPVFVFFFFRKGLYISDVPLHDAARDLVLLSEKFEAEYKLTKNLEMLTDKLQQTFRDLESEKQKTDR